MSWSKGSKKKKAKGNSYYNIKKVEVDGVVFDSKLESYMYGRLKQFSVPFTFQLEIELIPAFRDVEGAAVRRMFMLVDFVIKKNGYTYFADTKGWQTEKSKIKYKMLKHLIWKTDLNAGVIYLKNEKEVDSFINKITRHGNEEEA